MPTTIDDVKRLDERSSHADVRQEVSSYLEDLLEWTLRSESGTGSGGSIDSVPVTKVGDREVEAPAFVIEYKSGKSDSIESLQQKQGGQPDEIAFEQLERYVTTRKICNHGFLVDASRFIVYRRQGDSLYPEPEKHIVFEEATDDDFEELRQLLPLIEGLPATLQIDDEWEFVGVLEDSINHLMTPLTDLFEIIEPEEYELLLELMPSGLSEEEFIQKTASSIISKILLLRALEDQNGQFGIVLNPEVIQSFSQSQFGYLLAFSSAYDLGGMNYPQVMKADIDVFDWWEARQLISETREEAREAHQDLNRRMRNILEQLYRYEVEIEQDLMGMTYQRLRKRGETAVLGAYYTPPQLTDTTIDAIDTLIGELDITDYSRQDLYERPDFRLIDPMCGSGTFFISYIKQAMEFTDRARTDTAHEIIKKVHGIDVDPLAVLMARAQIYGSLSGEIDNPPSPNVYWTNTLEHIRSDPQQKLLDQFDDYKQIGAPIDEVKYDLQRAEDEIKEESFDLVMGNPPWGRRAEIVRHLRSGGYSRKEANNRIDELIPGAWNEMFDGRDDNLLTPFFAAADNLLADGGIMALILDARFQASEWGGEVVERLENYSETRVLDVSQSRDAEFRESVSYPAIVLGVK